MITSNINNGIQKHTNGGHNHAEHPSSVLARNIKNSYNPSVVVLGAHRINTSYPSWLPSETVLVFDHGKVHFNM